MSSARKKFQHAQTVEIEITDFKLEGVFWTPLVKDGKASMLVSIRGLGELKAYNESVYLEIKFTTTGPCSAYKLQKKIKNMGVNRAIRVFINAVSATS